MTSCCFTGHRSLPPDLLPAILANLDREIDRLIAVGVTTFLSGGALGFDQMAAAAIVRRRELGIPVRLIFALPCHDQDRYWTGPQRAAYQTLLGKADAVHYVSETYHPLCMRRRNEYLVERSAYCICALLHKKSGTGQTVRLACEKHRIIRNVVP